ncbi:amino acid permease [Bacillus sp. M6-12]|uniref:amino acid permease n=1 Tax=Bacillus sp. M6-12 TaxID=2054166 RepID=UPI000C774591|nr:amino acid permease [Bacillus sp. M6-12]PLS14664.1 amino acid permease [Bacillus sp. M6-12]
MSEKTSSPCEPKKGNLKWWQLSLIGVGCIIGTGYFLGSGIAIKKAGPAVLLAFLFAAIGTYVVYDALARMNADHPVKGSFCAYAKEAYGHWAGFSNGWVYWSAEVLIMGSQLTALGLFTRFWFPHIPLWIFASVYAVLGLLVVMIGLNAFEKVENIMAVIKILGIFMFIIIAALAVFHFIDGSQKHPTVPASMDMIFPNGLKGLWAAMIYAFYTFGGIEIMALMATKLKNPDEGPKAGKVMLSILAVIYVLSIGLAVLLVSWNLFRENESPFVTALDGYNLPFVPHVFNAILIIAGFSTMSASLYSVTDMLVNLAEDGDAPKVFAKKATKRKIPFPALIITAIGLIISIVLALLLPKNLFEHITTAAGLMLLYTWLFILFTFARLMKIKGFDQVKRIVGILLILAAVSGTLVEHASRPGFFISLAFLAVIGAATLIMRRKWPSNETEQQS